MRRAAPQWPDCAPVATSFARRPTRVGYATRRPRLGGPTLDSAYFHLTASAVCNERSRYGSGLSRETRVLARGSGGFRQFPDRGDRHRVAIAPPGAVAVRERMRGMAWTGWPDRVDEGIVEVLLYVADELLAPRRDAQHLDVRRRVTHDCLVARAERADDVTLEERNQLAQAESL